jgi:Fe-S-cluster-containing hydrogenase component 2
MEHPAYIDPAQCTGCTQCKLICPAHAIEQIADLCRVIARQCLYCGRCLHVCPNGCIAEQQEG